MTATKPPQASSASAAGAPLPREGGRADYVSSPVTVAIAQINGRFDFRMDGADRLLIEQWATDLARDPGLTEIARAVEFSDFRQAFERRALEVLITRAARDTELFERFMTDEDVRALLLDALAADYHANARRQAE